VKATGGRAESTVLGKDIKVPAANAALANGTMAHGFEAMMFLSQPSHPGAVVVQQPLRPLKERAPTGKHSLLLWWPGIVMNRIEKRPQKVFSCAAFPTEQTGLLEPPLPET
jgi:hypothetical protein